MPADPTGQATPLWVASAVSPEYPPLRSDTTADVVIVGAGIAGLTTAYYLARQGRSVVVLCDTPVGGGGETGRTTAHLASALDDRFTNLERLHGAEGARRAAESHAAAIDAIEQIADAEGIACDFERVDGYLFLAPGHERSLLEDELAAARRAGLQGTTLLERASLGGFDTGPCLRFPDQGQFHPLRYMEGLARAVTRLGGRIYTGSRARSITAGEPAVVVTDDGPSVEAGAVVVATNSPIHTRVAMHTKQAAYRTYAVALRIPAGSVPHALLWDTLDAYHYVRVQAGDQPGSDDFLIVGGEDHKTGQDEPTGRFEALEEWARTRFPGAGGVAFRWSGQVIEPFDGLAYIGRTPHDEPNSYLVTGDSGHGMTHGTIAGILISELIADRDHPWATLYDPRRTTLRSLGTFAAENANVAAQYADWLGGSEVGSADEIAPGCGAVLREGVRTFVAAYRDPGGQLLRRSAVCPHLGGVVHWNPTEHSWDCPCHGSRFSPSGEVLNGPSLKGLDPAEEPGDKPADR